MTSDSATIAAADFTEEQAYVAGGVQRVLALYRSWADADAEARRRVQEGPLSTEAIAALVAASGTEAPRQCMDKDKWVLDHIAGFAEGQVIQIHGWERFAQFFYYLLEEAKWRCRDEYEPPTTLGAELARAEREAWQQLYNVGRSK